MTGHDRPTRRRIVRLAPRRDDDRGLTLVETIVALTVLTIVAVPTTLVVLSSMERIGEARVETLALEIARSEIEELRSMPYPEIGTQTGEVSGPIPVEHDVTVEGHDFTVRTEVSWVDDHVPGGYRSRADYKQVTVTVTPLDARGIEPRVLSTQVAASGVSGKLQTGNVEVTVTELKSPDPDGRPVGDVWLHLLPGPELGPTLAFGPTHPRTQTYAGLTPNPDVADTDPRYEYQLGLTNVAGERTDGTYWMAPEDHVGSAPVRVLEYNTISREILVYRPGSLVVDLRDAADPQPATPDGNLLDDPELELVIHTSGDDPNGSAPYAPWDEMVVPVVNGRAVIEHFDQYASDPGASYGLVPDTWWLELRHATADLRTDPALGPAVERTTDAGAVHVELAVEVEPAATTAVTLWATWDGRAASASPTPRTTDGLVGLWTFDDPGMGRMAFDASGVGAPLHLKVPDSAGVTQAGGYLDVTGDVTIRSVRAATEETAAIVAAGEVTIEAWVRAADTTQDGPARVVSISDGTASRDLMLGQEAGDPASATCLTGVCGWWNRLRHEGADANGEPGLGSGPGTVDPSAVQHVVVTATADGERRVVVDGVEVAADTVGGFEGWNDTWDLVVANEVTGDRPWRGELHLIALYARALTPAEVAANLAAGPNP